MPVRQSKNCVRGFTLIETAIVIALVSMAMASWLSLYRIQFNKENFAVTRQRMDDIRAALADFQMKNKRLPCPAPLHATPADPPAAGFGREADAGSCALAGPQADTIRVAGTNGPVRIGVVPIATLGLSNEHLRDKWGRRFLYAVSERLAEKNVPWFPYDDNNGAITLKDNGGVTLGGLFQDKTPFVLLSFGKDGRGGVTYHGTDFQTCPTGPQNENCDHDTTFSAANYSESDADASRFTHLVMNFISRDPAAICGSKGMVYGPTHPQRDTEGCVATLVMPATGGVKLNTTGDCIPQAEGSIRYFGGKLELCNGANWLPQ